MAEGFVCDVTLDDGVVLLAPGGAYLPGHGVLVVADLHAGYVATLQARGYTLPAQADTGLHERLGMLLDRTGAGTVVVAGDLVHGTGALGRAHGVGGTHPSALTELLSVLAGRTLVVVPGNHDRGAVTGLQAHGVRVTETFTVGAYTVVHGDETVEEARAARARARAVGGRVIVGHHHTALTLDNGAGARRRVPAFAYGPGWLCLPALTPLARGADLLRADHARGVTDVVEPWELGVAVVVGRQVIPVGTLGQVVSTQRSGRPGRPARAGGTSPTGRRRAG